MYWGGRGVTEALRREVIGDTGSDRGHWGDDRDTEGVTGTIRCPQERDKVMPLIIQGGVTGDTEG